MSNPDTGEYFIPLDPAKRTPAQTAFAEQAKAASLRHLNDKK